MSKPLLVCPERDIECGHNATAWCASCPRQGQKSTRPVELTSVTLGQMDNRAERDRIQAEAYREIVRLMAANKEPNIADPFIVDVAALIHRTHKEVMKSNTIERAAKTRME